MEFYNQILTKLGIDPPKADSAPAATVTAAKRPPASIAAAPAPAPTAQVAPKAVKQVDVVAQLEQKAAADSQKLNWRTSIVDLLKLLDIDSSLAARKELAAELGCPVELMSDSATMNMWLHKSVLKRIADNGGNVPADLLH